MFVRGAPWRILGLHFQASPIEPQYIWGFTLRNNCAQTALAHKVVHIETESTQKFQMYPWEEKTGMKPIIHNNGWFVADFLGIRNERLKAKTTTLVLAYHDGAPIIGGSYLLLNSEDTCSNYVFAQVTVMGVLLGGQFTSYRCKFQSKNKNTNIHPNKQRTKKRQTMTHTVLGVSFHNSNEKMIHPGIEFHPFHDNYCTLQGEGILANGNCSHW